MTSISENDRSWRRPRSFQCQQKSLLGALSQALAKTLQDERLSGVNEGWHYEIVVPQKERKYLPPDLSVWEARLTEQLISGREGVGIGGSEAKVAVIIAPVTSIGVYPLESKPDQGEGSEAGSTQVFRCPLRPGLSLMPRWLKILEGPGHGETISIWGDRILIGRRETNQVTLKDSSVSRKHAQIVRTPSDEYIEDLGSLNGTWVNGSRLEAKVLIKPGDEITLGTTTLVYLDRDLID